MKNISLHYKACGAIANQRRGTCPLRHPDDISLMRLAPIPICSLSRANELCADIAFLLNFDVGLPENIRPSQVADLETPESVLSYTRDWCVKKRALFYAIVLNRQAAIGTISLSQLDLTSKTARCGLWLGSQFQGRGYGSAAVASLLREAGRLGLKEVGATIAANNYASRAVWSKFGAAFVQQDDRLNARVAISQIERLRGA